MKKSDFFCPQLPDACHYRLWQSLEVEVEQEGSFDVRVVMAFAANLLNMAKLCHLLPLALFDDLCIPPTPDLTLFFHSHAFFFWPFLPAPGLDTTSCEE